jgi:hypothetical protein
MTYQDLFLNSYRVRYCNPEQALLVAVIQLSMIGKLWEETNEQIEVTQDLEHIMNTTLLPRPETLPKCQVQELRLVLFLESLWKTDEINLAQVNMKSLIRIYARTLLLREVIRKHLEKYSGHKWTNRVFFLNQWPILTNWKEGLIKSKIRKIRFSMFTKKRLILDCSTLNLNHLKVPS